jgi:hypothetical protein
MVYFFRQKDYGVQYLISSVVRTKISWNEITVYMVSKDSVTCLVRIMQHEVKCIVYGFLVD